MLMRHKGKQALTECFPTIEKCNQRKNITNILEYWKQIQINKLKIMKE